MIPNHTRQVEVAGNVKPLRHRAMTVNVKALPYIMELLTKLYSDNELACIREYSTNAWDSHIEAGTTHLPIEVNTPSQLSPFLSVKDYGVGLSGDELLDMYSEYGASTKREDALQNGHMGVGSKSALAYTTQFTMIAVKNGTRCEVSISMDEQGIGDVAIISEEPTDEPNGVEVQIPAKRENSFGEKAKNFFQFWPEGTVLLNGREPERSLRKLSERIYFYDGDTDVVVMGNVAYPVRYDQAISRNTQRSVACFVTMNGDDEVVHVPAREALVYDPITVNSLTGLREEFNDAVKEFIKESIATTTTRKDALDMWREMKDIFGYGCANHFEWNGESVDLGDFLTYPFKAAADSNEIEKHRSAIEFDVSKHRNAVSHGSRISVNYLMNKGLVITGFPADSLSSAYRARIRLYVAEKGIKTGGYNRPGLILISEDNYANDPWHNTAIEGKTVAWKDVLAATKPEKRERVIVERDGAYDVLVDGANTYQEMDLDYNDNIVYYTVADYGTNGLYGDYARYVFDEEPDAKIVCVRANRIAKLKRLHRNVREFDLTYWLKLKGKKYFATLSPEQIETLKQNYIYRNQGDYRHNYSDFGVNKKAYRHVDSLDDKEYAGVLRGFFGPSVPNENLLEYSEEFLALRETWKDKAVRWDKRYPLAQWDNYPTETLEYVNTAYAKNGENNE